MPRFSKLAVIATVLAALGWGPAGGCGSKGDDQASADAAPPVPTPAPTPKDAGDDASTLFSAMRAAADAFNAKYCEAFRRCDPTSFEFTFGTRETCLGAGGLVAISSGTVRYVNELAAPYAYGSQLTPDGLVACAAALDFATCDKWVRFYSEHVIPDACRPAFFGTLPKDSPCGVWNQCASGRCLQEANAPQEACGKCIDPSARGASCRDGACEPRVSCRGATAKTKTCVAFVDLGSECGEDKPCHDDLVCSGGFCVKPAADGSCDPAVGCSAMPRQYACDPSQRKCVPIPFANLGEPCGDIPGSLGGHVTCVHGTTCTVAGPSADGGAPAAPLECESLVRDGDVCFFSPAFDNHCERPDSVCFRDTCQQNGPAQCTAPPVLP
jgi:hypothetical protein